MRIPTHEEPIHPGIMLQEEFLEPMGVTPKQLADSIDIPYQHVREIINKRRCVTPQIASLLGGYFGMTAQYWINSQKCWDLYMQAQREKEVQKGIPVFWGVTTDQVNNHSLPYVSHL